MSEAPVYPGTIIPITAAQSLLTTAGRAGTTLHLVPGEQNVQFSWSPFVKDPRDGHQMPVASDHDLQIMWVAAEKPLYNPPLVYWRIEYGHGEAVYGLPMRTSLGGAPDRFNAQFGWMLPQRGLRMRFPSRQCRVHFFTPAESTPPPEPAEPGGAPCSLQISIQPCEGLHPQQMPMTDGMFSQIIDPTLSGAPAQLPLGATEMRLTDPTDGQAFAGGQRVAFYDVTGAPSGGGLIDMALFAEWTPIPIFAAFWACELVAAQASYR